MRASPTPIALTLLLALAGLLQPGCGEAGSNKLEVTLPTVEPVPARTRVAEVLLSGTRTPKNAIWAQLKTHPNPILLAPAVKNKRWSGTLILDEGVNTLVVFASDPDNVRFSQPSPEVQIELDSTPPVCPALTPHPGTLEVGVGQSIPFTLSGTKGADGDLVLNGEEVAPRDGQTTWSAAVTLTSGANLFTLGSTDDMGNSTDATGCPAVSPLTITGSAITAPTFVSLIPSETRSLSLSISGTKPAGSALVVTHTLQGSSSPLLSEVEIVPHTSSTLWSYNDIPWAQGLNTLSLSAWLPDISFGSPASLLTVRVDSVAPAPLTVTAPTSPTGESTITVTGEKDPDGDVCLRHNQEAGCTQVVGIEASSPFSHSLALVEGDNVLTYTSRDRLGNESAAVEVPVVHIPAPAITLLTPGEGGIIVKDSIPTKLRVKGGALTGADVSEVELCLDATCVDITSSRDGNNGYSHTLDSSQLVDGTRHTLRCSATNSAGISSSLTVNLLYNPGVFILSSASNDSRQVAAATGADGLLHVAWSEDCAAQSACPGTAATLGRDILYRRFTPATSAWSETVLVSDGAGDGDSVSPAIAVDSSGEVHLVWSDSGSSAGTEWNLYHRIIVGSTGAMGAVAVVGDSALQDVAPALAAGLLGRVSLSWTRHSDGTDGEIYYSRWAGGAWQAPRLVSDHARDGNSTQSQLATDAAGDVHLVWVEDGDIRNTGSDDDDVYYRRVVNDVLLDPGYLEVTSNTRDSSVSVTCQNDCASPSRATDPDCEGCHPTSSHPDVAVGSNETVYIVWADTLPTEPGFASRDTDIYLHRFRQGQSLDADSSGHTDYQAVDSGLSSHDSSRPVVSVTAEGKALVVWQEESAGQSAGLAYALESESIANFVTFHAMVPLAAAGGPVESPALVQDAAHNLHLLWGDRDPTLTDADFVDSPTTDSVGDNFDILYTVLDLAP